MPVLAVNQDAATFTHQCVHCGYTDELHLDPTNEQLTVHDACLSVRACPQCAQRTDPRSGRQLIVTEHLIRDIPAWEAGEEGEDGTPAKHPDSLVGQRTHLPNGQWSEVIEHHIGHTLNAEHVRWRRNIRAMQRHPALAPHAPLRVP